MANQTAFNLGGRGKSSRKKSKPKSPVRLPNTRKITTRDIERQVLKQSGAWDTAKKLHDVPTDAERILKASGLPPGVLKGLSEKEQQQFEADLSFLGITYQRTSGTLPERLVAKYLWKTGLPYEGMSYQARPYQGWSFQVPLLGGRAGSGGGAVADLYLAKSATISGKDTIIRVNGSYWHNQPGAPAHDKKQKDSLERAGYGVVDMLDTEDILPGNGAIDRILRPLIK